MNGIQPQAQLEDILAHIPCSRVLQYKTHDTIYREGELKTHVYLVIAGMVKVSTFSRPEQELIVDLYGPDEFFGLSSFLSGRGDHERAVALRAVQLMKWPVEEIKEMIIRQPRLGIALLQLAVNRSSDFESRVAVYSLDTVPGRLCRSLLYLAGRLGTRTRDGKLQVPPLTHMLLSEFLGTSRTMVSKCMSGLRRNGLIDYSRGGITLHRDRMERWLDRMRDDAPR